MLVELEAARPRSLVRVTLLLDLATLAHGNHDNFEAANWLNDGIADLADIGYPVPGPDGTDAAVEGWIEAIPPGDGTDPIYFTRRLSALITLHTKPNLRPVGLAHPALTCGYLPVGGQLDSEMYSVKYDNPGQSVRYWSHEA